MEIESQIKNIENALVDIRYNYFDKTFDCYDKNMQITKKEAIFPFYTNTPKFDYHTRIFEKKGYECVAVNKLVDYDCKTGQIGNLTKKSQKQIIIQHLAHTQQKFAEIKENDIVFINYDIETLCKNSTHVPQHYNMCDEIACICASIHYNENEK